MNNRINPNESDFVKSLRKTHCKGCMNEGGYCDARGVLDCWLRKRYLPDGEWDRACKNDIEWKLTCDIANEIDKKILKNIIDKFDK